jgi:hypothetical protein
MEMKKQNRNNRKIFLRNITVLSLIFSLFTLSLHAQGDLPGNIEKDNFSVTLGLSLTCLPTKIVEEEISTMPMISVGLNYKLGAGFELGANFRTAYITNVLTASLSKSFDFGLMQFVTRYDVSYWMGMANIEGFDANCHGSENEFSAGFQVPFNDHKISFKTGFVYNNGQDVRVGSASYSKPCNAMTGMVYEVNYNQKLGDFDLILGAKLSHCSSSYNTWIAFSNCQQRLLSPTFFVGVKF